jgi:hypothetical protein
MNNLICNNKIYTPYEFVTEREFEEEIINHFSALQSEQELENLFLQRSPSDKA